MFRYLVKGFDVPVRVTAYRVEEMHSVHELVVQLEIHDEPVKRRLIIHKIGTVLRALGKIPQQSRVVGISTGYMANGEKRIFLATYLKEKISDDLDLDSGHR